MQVDRVFYTRINLSAADASRSNIPHSDDPSAVKRKKKKKLFLNQNVWWKYVDILLENVFAKQGSLHLKNFV